MSKPKATKKVAKPNLFFELDKNDSTKLIVSGKTFNVKDKIKEIGGSWNPRLSQWSIPVTADTPEMREGLEEDVKKVKNKEANDREAARLYAKSPEGKAAAATDEKLRVKAAVAAGSTWICCENCEVIDWTRKHTSCNTCGCDGNTFFVNGKLRTGD